ncbi:uncharacterized protein BJ212DRAFT_588309 [Suillus subaureus]|uniref:Chromatin-remodeling ATPase INO80 n=1 Tax=Suillus subaureus TaxID=48587 RepID=A0A9P7JAA9_9AGAM|nr:uncharacterized protein BJ212DRAFT_588309 [Suillus subaureus]KAG1810670.1 hypothetical protein BJ212DRAFT_588309 [Suillus subaureus]
MGKMLTLGKLLKSMNEKGSRVLIFSQMIRVLNILEEYRLFRGFTHDDQIVAIDENNKPGSDRFIFLLTTRASGLGNQPHHR